MPYNFLCTILSENATLRIEINGYRLLDDLKEEIRAERIETLASFGADDLTLYKVGISVPDEETLKKYCRTYLSV